MVLDTQTSQEKRLAKFKRLSQLKEQYDVGEDASLVPEMRSLLAELNVPYKPPKPVVTTPPFIPTGLTPAPVSLEMPTLGGDYGLIYKDYLRTGGKLDVVNWGASGAPLRSVDEVEPTDDELGNFLEKLVNVGQIGDVEGILRQVGYTEEQIDEAVGIQTRQNELEGLVAKTFPEYDLEGFTNLIDTDFEGFIDKIRTGGRTKEKQDLLRMIGLGWEDVAEVFSVQKIVVSVKGVRELVTWDTTTDRVYDQNGKFVGTYNPITRDVEDLTFGEKVGDFLEAWTFASIGAWQRTKGFILTMLPKLIFRDMTPLEREIQGDEWADETNRRNRELRDSWRAAAAREQVAYESYIKGHPELKPRLDYEEGASKHPELWKDPGWWAYEFASMVPNTIASMAVGAAVTGLTGGNWIVGAAAAGAVQFPMEVMGVRDDLLTEGVPEDQVDEIALIAGMPIVLLESVGRLPVLSAVSPAVTRMFRREAIKQITRLTIRQMAKKGIIIFTSSQFAETMTEILQEAIGNAAAMVAGLDRSIFANFDVIATKTFAGVVPFSLVGLGASFVRVSPSQTQGLTNAQMKAKGWVLDTKTGNWYEKVELPVEGVPEVVAPVTEVTPLVVEPIGVKEGIPEKVTPAKEVTIPTGWRTEVGKITVKPGMEEVVTGKAAVDWQRKVITVSDVAYLQDSSIMNEEIAHIRLEELPDVTKQSAISEYEKAAKYAPIEIRSQFARREGFGQDYGKYLTDPSNVTPEIAAVFEKYFPAIPKAEVPEAVRPKLKAIDIGNNYAIRDSRDIVASLKKPEDFKDLQSYGEYMLSQGYKATYTKRTGKTVWEKVAEAPAITEVPAAVPVEEAAPPIEGVVAPPMPEGAAKRVFDRIQTEPAETGFTEKVRQGYHKFQVKMIDDLYSIKKFTEAYTKGGVELSIEENPYLLARLLRGISGKANVFIEQGTFGKTFWKIEKGKAVPNFTGESLENILKEVREPGAWQDFSTYLVARRSVELSARDIETGIELADAQSAIQELEAKHKNFSDLAKRVYKYQDNLLVYGQEMGLLSDDLLGKLRKYGNYVPFYRVFNELQAKGFMGKKMADIASPIKKIKGSEREIINPLESIIKNTYVMISAADRNRVGIMMANLVDKNPELAETFERVKTPMARVAGVTAKELGVEIEGLSAEDAEAVVDIFRPSFFVRGDEVTVLIDGKKAYFKIDPDLRDGLLSLDRETMGMIGRFLSYPAKWLRAGATLSPDFMVRNPARDALTAFVFSNYNFLPGVDFMRGIAGIIRKDADYQLYRASGAEHSMMVSMDREYLHKTFNEVVQGKKFTDYVKHPLELFQIISELGEKGTRLGEFKAGIRRGARPLEAGYSARAVTLDFAQAGTTAHALNRIAAFFNANIRGNTRIISSFKEHPVRTSLKIFVGITLPSILLYYANRDDERWKEIPQWQKDIFWIVFVGDKIFRIPKPFGLGQIFGSVPERFLEWLDTKDPDMMKNVLQTIIESGTPNPLPTAAMPIIEWMSNYSFFRGQAIVPASRAKMPPELQYTRWTSEVSKKLGELLKLPPAKIDNLINGWTGGLGRYATDILDSILKKTGISPDIPEPSPELADIPVLRAFVVRNPYGSSGEAVESFYNTLEKYEQGEKYLQEMLKLDEKEKFEAYKAKHPELLFFLDFDKEVFYSASARYLRRVARDLSELSKKQDLIYKDKDISSAEKRRLIDEIDMLKTELARKTLDLLQGKEPQLLQDSLNESINRLGEVIEETPVLSLEKPDIFDMRELHTDFGTTLEAATEEDLDKLTGIDLLAYAYLEVKKIEETIDSIPNKKIYEIKPDLKEGVTFEDYYKAWQVKIIKDEVLDNLSRQEVELLRKYHGLDKAGQKQFLIDHPELTKNPRDESLKASPKANALLVIWGQAKLLTKEAYTEFLRLIKELDIPDSAIPEMSMPPEGSIDNYFKYQDMDNKNSWEAQLMLAKDPDLLEFLGRQPIDTPIASLEIKTKPEFRQIYDKINDLGDKDSPDYIADEKARAEAIKKLKTQDYIDDTRRIEAIEKGTGELTQADIEWDLYKTQKIENAIEQIVFSRKTHETFKWGTEWDTKVMGWYNEISSALEGIRAGKPDLKQIKRAQDLILENIKVDTEWLNRIRAGTDNTGVSEISVQSALTGYAFVSEVLDRASERDIVEKHVDYGKLIDKEGVGSSSAEVMLYRVDNPDYDKWRTDTTIWSDQALKPIDQTRIPIWRIDVKYAKEDAEYDDLTGTARDDYLAENEDYRLDRRRREAYQKGLTDQVENYVSYYELPVKGYRQERFLINNPDFANALGLKVPDKVPSEQYDILLENEDRTPEDDLRMDAYKLYVPDNQIENYAGYKTIPTGAYEDDWFLQEHTDFYKQVYLGILGKERKDYRKVPTREVFALYQQYLDLDTTRSRENYRFDNPDLEDWLILTGKVTKRVSETRRKAALSPAEKLAEEVAERLRKIRELGEPVPIK